MMGWAWASARVVVAGAMFAAAAPAAGGQTAGAVAISNGLAMIARNDVSGAAREFRRAARDSDATVRSVGEQWLGHLAWMVYADATAAAEHLDRAVIGARDSSSILVERARLLRFRRRYREATRVAFEALRCGAEGERRGLAARALVDAAVDGAFAAIGANASVADSIEPLLIREALDTLRGRVDRFPGRTIDAWAMLGAGALVGDREAIGRGAASYFLLTHGMAGPPRPPPTDNVANLAMHLADSRLYEPAALLLDQERLIPGRKLSAKEDDAVAYGPFVHRIRAAANEFYRRALLGLAKDGDLDRSLNAQTRLLWRALHWPSGHREYYPAAVPGELARRFGTVLGIDQGPAIPELHLAQAIGTYTAVTAADSFHRRARVIVLDAIASNGLEFWLLDGIGGRAGWVSGDSILEIRPALTEAPFRAWIALTDPRAISAEQLRRDDAADITRARADSVAFLPGVAARLFRAGISTILDSLSRETMSATQRQAAFVGILFNQLTETTIALHESRHLADGRRRPTSRADAEFRAKIDEVAFASRPRLAMTAILHPNIGDATPHGQANRRVMLGLIRWIRGHTSEIVGFDASVPPLVQLPQLTDAQLRAAFHWIGGSQQSTNPPGHQPAVHTYAISNRFAFTIFRASIQQ